MNVAIRRKARADVRSIRNWYDLEESGLGDHFLSELDLLVARIGQMPEQFPEVHPGLRRGLLQRFPYAVYFLPTPDHATILAVIHQH